MKFYRCSHCGNIIVFLHESGAPVSCCGEPMSELAAGATDGAQEKHVPFVSVDGNKVCIKVGEAEHPMLEKHFIEFIVLETTAGFQMKKLAPGEKPEAAFVLAEGEKAVAAYEYCNLHGLWKKEL